jgi:hypothetical protein
MFRESGCVGHFAKLLHEVFPPEGPEAQFIAESREKAGWGVLQLLRLFLVRGENSTVQNQAAFFRADIAQTSTLVCRYLSEWQRSNLQPILLPTTRRYKSNLPHFSLRFHQTMRLPP